MSRVRNRLSDYRKCMSDFTEQGEMLTARSVLNMIERLQDDLEQDKKESGWIPVSERLPEKGTYIVTFDGELIGQKEPFTGMCGIENGKWDEEDCVIAWMPLPEPYKEE